MIVYNFDQLEDFLESLQFRVNGQVFSQYIEPQTPEGPSRNHRLILQFLGRPDSSNVYLTILYQCILEIRDKEGKQQIMKSLKDAFAKVGEIRLIQGSITEIIMSIN